jgi:uncharacterized protein YdiU (UPF0061 family)
MCASDFQFFAARGDVEATRKLADYVIAAHYPEAAEATNLLSPSSHRTQSRTGGEMAARQLHPRCYEHRQHVDRGRNHRLQSLRVHGRL